MYDELVTILCQQLPLKPADISPESKIKEDLGADSLDILQLLMTLEETHGIRIPDEALAEFETVRDIVDYLDRQ